MILGKRTFKFLFVAYFLFYAISPLCYSDSQIGDTSIVIKQTRHESKNIRPFLLDIIYSKLTQKKDTPENSNDVYLIEKIRAILGPNNIGNLMQEYSISTEKLFILPSVQSYTLPVLTLPPLYNGFHPLFSGLSPPSF